MCEMSEYSKRYPNIFEDATGHRNTFVDAVSLRAKDIFRGINDGDTVAVLKTYLQRDVNQFDWNTYSYWMGSREMYTCRLEFIYNGYLFSIKTEDGDSSADFKYDAVSYDPDWQVFITNLNIGGNYTDIAGTYIQVGDTDNFGESDLEFGRVPQLGTLLIVEPNSQGYLAKRYCCDEQGRWVQDEFYLVGKELQLFYSAERGGYTSLYGENWWYLDIFMRGNKMELAGDGDGVIYRKIDRSIISTVTEQ